MKILIEKKKIFSLRHLWILILLTFCNLSSAQNWIQAEKIVAIDRAAFNNFGSTVAINGDYSVVGARYNSFDALGGNEKSSAGAAYIFKKNGDGNWIEITKIVASDRAANDNFGISVAIDGDYILVGAAAEDHYVPSKNYYYHSAGAAYIFKKDEGGTDNWGEVKKIIAEDGSGYAGFGGEVAIFENYILIGATGEGYDALGNNSLSSAGAAYIFKKEEGGTDNWGQLRKLVPNDRDSGDRFGNSVSINENFAVVGAYWEDDDENNLNSMTNAGSAYLFKKDEGGVDNWSQTKKIVASDRESNSEFGSSVALSSNFLIIGADNKNERTNTGVLEYNVGAVYVYKKEEGGIDNYGQTQKLLALDKASYDGFGNSIAIDNNKLIVGSWTNDTDESSGNQTGNAGAAYIFKEESGNWQETQKIVASDRAIGDLFGQDVAIQGGTILVGADEEAEDASGMNTLTRAGSTYIFSSSCSEKPIFSASVENFCDQDEYQITISVTDFGGASTVEIVIDGQVEIANAQLNQSYSFGPYQASISVVVRDKDDNLCANTNTYAINCNPTQIVKLYNFSDPHPSSIDGFAPRFLNRYEGESLPNTYNFFGNNYYSQDNHLWEFDGCQFTEVYEKDYSLFSENLLDGRGNLIVYGYNNVESEAYVFKYDGQNLTKIDNPSGYSYSYQFHLANSSDGYNYFIYFSGQGQSQTYKIFYLDDNDVLHELPNPTGYRPTTSLPLPLERGFADRNGNVFILYQKTNNEYDRIWGVHDGSTLSLLNYPDAAPFAMDFKDVTSNGDVIFAEQPDDPAIPHVYKYNENGLTPIEQSIINPSGGPPIPFPILIDDKIVGSDGVNDYFSSGGNGLIRYDGQQFDYINPPGGSGSKFLKIGVSGLLWGGTVQDTYNELYTFDGTNYTAIPNPTGYHVSNNGVVSNGKHFFVYGKDTNDYPYTLNYNIAFVENNNLTLLNNEQEVINDIWLDETTDEVYVVQGNWGYYFNTDLPNAYYQSNQNALYRFNAGVLELLPLPNNYSWFEDVYLLNGKTVLVLKPAYDSNEMTLFTIENNVVTPLTEHITVQRIHTPKEAEYMLISANDYKDIVKILPDNCDNTPCPMTLDISGDPFRIGYFQASQHITMSKVSEALCKVVAGETITLQPGFHAKQGSEFLAQVGFDIVDYTSCSSPINKKTPYISKDIVQPTIDEKNKELKVFPNPFSNSTIIQFDLPKDSKVQLYLHNMNGQRVKTIYANTIMEKGRHQVEMEKGFLPAGIYILNLLNNKEKYFKKIMIVE